MANYQLSINNYQLPEGYKQTEVGVIPEDWEIKPLGDFISLQRGYDLTAHERRPGNIPVMGAAGQNGFHNEALVKGPGIILGRSGASFGQVYYCESDYWPHNTGLYATDLHDNDPLFTFYFLDSLDFSRYNSGGAQQSLNRNFIYPILIAVPNVQEQRAIAQTLSDVDALIAALDKLIAKQRHLKTATMQQLLTGKKRLPGFGEGKGYKQTEVGSIPDDWNLHPLGEITEYIKGFAFKSSDFQAHGVRVIRVSDTTFDLIKDDIEIFIDENRAKDFKKWAMKESDLIISTVGSKPPMYDSMVGKATFVDAKNRNSLLNQNAVIIRSKDWSREAQVFLHNHLKQPRYIDHIEKIFRGNANQASITLKELFKFLIPIPGNSEEQRAIATVLSDMDAAISALETRRAKTQAIKQGMMQELLTGRVRLTIDSASQ